MRGVASEVTVCFLRRVVAAAIGWLGIVTAAPIQAQLVVAPRSTQFWAGAAALAAGAAASDAALSSSAGRNQHTFLNRAANALEPAGTQRYDLPVLAGAWVVGRVAGREPGNAILRIAAGFVAADLLESLLKPVVGRHRPDTLGGDPWRLRPFSSGNEWHSLPSGHTTHVFSLAAGIAQEVHSPVVRVAAYGTACLVGWQRIESRAHWPSDVVVSAALAIAASETTHRFLRRATSRQPSAPGRIRLLVTPTSLGVSVATGP
jgi:membrane-associated phospholipid phosphatase